MKWVTRERPKTDRIACPWLIRKFIDPEAEIVYVPRDDVLPYANREGAISFERSMKPMSSSSRAPVLNLPVSSGDNSRSDRYPGCRRSRDSRRHTGT